MLVAKRQISVMSAKQGFVKLMFVKLMIVKLICAERHLKKRPCLQFGIKRLGMMPCDSRTSTYTILIYAMSMYTVMYTMPMYTMRCTMLIYTMFEWRFIYNFNSL